VSIDYNEPVKLESLMRKGEDWLRNVYNNIINTNNKVNIMSVKGGHLNITETDKYDYILTYSFPCQDLSKAGLRKGMSDKTTRSGLLWEVERILSECKELPQILLMENVPDVIGSRFIGDFQRWEERLRELGYSNHTEILNSKDFGIPQNRERAFMVSILGSSLYHFPQKQPLKLRLKDMLEKEVDEKYYLSDEKIQSISQWKAQQDPLDTMEKTDKLGISPTLTARGAGEDHSGMILVKEIATFDETKEFANYLTWKDDKGRLNTQDHRAYFEDRLSGTIPAMERGVPNVLKNNLRIRKLTPKECYRLMGFGDQAFELAAPNQSNSSLYHQAGDSIVVNVLMELFRGLL
jgi:DNA (cytosine-5)-methyltransferase 1